MQNRLSCQTFRHELTQWLDTVGCKFASTSAEESSYQGFIDKETQLNLYISKVVKENDICMINISIAFWISCECEVIIWKEQCAEV